LNFKFQVSQGSAETHLRRGGKYWHTFCRKFLVVGYATVKEFGKSVNFCQSYEEMVQWHSFLDSQCIILNKGRG